MGTVFELEGELDRGALGALDLAFDGAAQAGMALAAERIGGAFGIKLSEGLGDDL